VGGGFGDLGVDDGEVFAQDGDGNDGTRGLEVGQAALEKLLVGEDGEGGGASGGVGPGNCDRLEVGGEDSFAGGGLLDFGDDRRLLRDQGGAKIAVIGARFGQAIPFVKAGLRKDGFAAFDSDNSGQDVWNSLSQRG
jgi:hypothetical protein